MPFLLDNPYVAAGATHGALQALDTMREDRRWSQAFQMRNGTHPDQIRQRQMMGEMWARYNQQRGDRDPDDLQFELDGIDAGFLDPGELFKWEYDRKKRAEQSESAFQESMRRYEAQAGMRLSEDAIKRERERLDSQRRVEDNLDIMGRAKMPDGTPLLGGPMGPAIEVAIRGGAKPFEALKSAIEMQQRQAMDKRREAEAAQRQANADRDYQLAVEREQRLKDEAGQSSTNKPKPTQREIDLHNFLFEAPPQVIGDLLNPQPKVKTDKEGNQTSEPLTAEDWQKSANATTAIRQFIRSEDVTYGYLRQLGGKLAMAPKELQDEVWTKITKMEQDALEVAQQLATMPDGQWQHAAEQAMAALGFGSIEELMQAAEQGQRFAGSP